MKALIQDFINHLIIYDYLFFGGIIIIFILLLIFAIVLRHKIGWAIFFVLLAFGVLTGGSLTGYTMLHHYLFQKKLLIHEIKALEFTEALLIKGDINNTSKRTFNECFFKAEVYKVTHNKFIDPIYPYIPFKKGSLRLKKELLPGESASFKLFVEPFRYTKEYNVTIKAECR